MISWLTARERWLPAVASLAWWMIFHPGFISEDSIINLSEARAGTISVVFTAWWVYVVDALSLGTRNVPLLTLINVLMLEYAVYLWIITVFPQGRSRAITVLLIAVSPLVAALGIQVRHDGAMAAGLFMCAIVLTRTWPGNSRFSAMDLTALGLAAPLVATRQNGAPTLLLTVLLLLVLRKWRHAAAVAAVAAAAIVIGYSAARAAGHSRTVEPVQAVESMMADISCLLAQPGINLNHAEWEMLSRIASRPDWPQERACWFLNPIYRTPTFNPSALEKGDRDVGRVWLALGARYPVEMAVAHAKRVRMFLPPLVTGLPHRWVENFLHSTILPNDFGLAWKFPALAEPARTVVRGYNAFGLVLSHAGLWLMVLLLLAWRLPDYPGLVPTVVVAAALDVGLVVAAPLSEGRYGLFILICGHTAGIFFLARRTVRSAT
jgi:hypothetical protein